MLVIQYLTHHLALKADFCPRYNQTSKLFLGSLICGMGDGFVGYIGFRMITLIFGSWSQKLKENSIKFHD
jgi:hypothetical protein